MSQDLTVKLYLLYGYFINYKYFVICFSDVDELESEAATVLPPTRTFTLTQPIHQSGAPPTPTRQQYTRMITNYNPVQNYFLKINTHYL